MRQQGRRRFKAFVLPIPRQMCVLYHFIVYQPLIIILVYFLLQEGKGQGEGKPGLQSNSLSDSAPWVCEAWKDCLLPMR